MNYTIDFHNGVLKSIVILYLKTHLDYFVVNNLEPGGFQESELKKVQRMIEW
jgi:hypothetical protein